MTYWAYHLLFILPPILFLLWRVWPRIRTAHVVCWLVVCAIVFTFTTPWDNYAAFLGIWGFGDCVSLGYPFSTLAHSAQNPEGFTWLGHIPVEEYSYFILEATLACLTVLWLLPEVDSHQT